MRVIEGMTMASVHDELRSALDGAGLADRVEIAAADPPHDWVPPSSATDAGRLTGHRLLLANRALVRAYTTPPRLA